MIEKITNRIAVAIPYTNINNVLQYINASLKEDINFIEIRFDYNEKFKKLQDQFKEKYILNEYDRKKYSDYIKNNILLKNEISAILKFKENHNNLKFIFTLRKKEEGGIYYLPESIRIDLINYLIDFKPDFIDIESQLSKELLNDFNIRAKKRNVSIIFSYHNWNNTPSEGEINRIINNLRSKCPDVEPLEEGKRQNRNVLKLIFTANKITDNHTVLSICQKYSSMGLKIVIFCMGNEGIPSRVGCLKFGAYLSFASISKSTAPGQIHIRDFKEMLSNKI
ncbi:MAG: type I 3-dehydroquinate dehydratase [Promethearchaeota archaeon]